jgi:type III secretory pathway component EscV
MYQNMRVIIKGMENESYETYLQEVMDFDNKIKDNYKGVQQLDEKNIIEHFEHLYYYNQLYENLNKRNIHLFNLENTKVLLNQMEYTYEDIVRRQWDIITNKNFLFGKYV